MEVSSTRKPVSDSELSSLPDAALSIHEIVRRYCRERLMVEPLHWTGRQVELLQCSFTGPSPAPTTTSESNYTGERAGLVHMRRYFRFSYQYGSREDFIESFLTAPECPLTSRNDGLSFFLNHRSLKKKLPCIYYFIGNEPSNESLASRHPGRVLMAHIDREHIASMRERMYMGFCFSKRYSSPVATILGIKKRSLIPPEPLHDPYIVALLIAVAQRQRIAIQELRPDEEARITVHPSKVLCSSKDKESIDLYSANIPCSLLDKFDYPSIRPSIPPSFQIQITTIPFNPCETLRDRLFPLLLSGTYYNHERVEKRKMDVEETQQQPTRYKAEDSIACS